MPGRAPVPGELRVIGKGIFGILMIRGIGSSAGRAALSVVSWAVLEWTDHTDVTDPHRSPTGLISAIREIGVV